MNHTAEELAAIESRMSECSECGREGVHCDTEDGTLIRGDVDIMVSSADYTILACGRDGGTEIDKLFCEECARTVLALPARTPDETLLAALRCHETTLRAHGLGCYLDDSTLRVHALLDEGDEWRAYSMIITMNEDAWNETLAGCQPFARKPHCSRCAGIMVRS